MPIASCATLLSENNQQTNKINRCDMGWNFRCFHLVFNLYCSALVFFFLFLADFDMGSKFGLEVIFFFLMFICISHYFFHYSIWDSLIFSIFSQCSSRINLISNFILKQIFLFIVVDFSLGCLILVDKKLRL